MSIEEELARRLEGRLTLPVSARLVVQAGRQWLIVEPADLAPGYAFAIQMFAGVKALEAEFVTGSGASNLPHKMALMGLAARERFAERAQACRSAGALLHLELDGKWIDDRNCGTWPTRWSKFVLRAEVPGDFVSEQDLVMDWAERLLALILSLIPSAAAVDRVLEITGLPEGALSRVEVNRYERNPINRANCIAALGDTCLGCGTNFGTAYGEIGEGYIHVHHTVPVSKLRELGDDYRIDPVRDLVPLCPNCHAMVHRKDPPLTVDELKIILGRTQSAQTDCDRSPA